MSITVVNKKIAYESESLKIVTTTFTGLKGEQGTWDFVSKKNDIASVIAFTSDKKIVLIRQFRIPIESYVLQLPVGKIDKEDVDPVSAAERELLEETGYVVDKMVPLSTYYSSPSLIDNKLHLFCGFNAKKVTEPQHENTEDIEVVLLSKEELMARLSKENVNMGILSALVLTEHHIKSK